MQTGINGRASGRAAGARDDALYSTLLGRKDNSDVRFGTIFLSLFDVRQHGSLQVHRRGTRRELPEFVTAMSIDCEETE
jgi:hypothetical protein